MSAESNKRRKRQSTFCGVKAYWQKVDPKLLKEFSEAMQKEVIPAIIENQRKQQERQWNKKKVSLI